MRQLEQDYRNIEVTATASGKMNADLVVFWVRKVLLPVVRSRLLSIETDTDIDSADSDDTRSVDDVFEPGPVERTAEDLECHQVRLDSGRQGCYNRRKDICVAFDKDIQGCMRRREAEDCCEGNLNVTATQKCYNEPHTLLLMDSWGGHAGQPIQNHLRSGIRSLIIPPRTTADIQPLDVIFNRQYKWLIERITEEAIHTNQSKNLQENNISDYRFIHLYQLGFLSYTRICE